jgi:hypothetical protein
MDNDPKIFSLLIRFYFELNEQNYLDITVTVEPIGSSLPPMLIVTSELLLPNYNGCLESIAIEMMTTRGESDMLHLSLILFKILVLIL